MCSNKEEVGVDLGNATTDEVAQAAWMNREQIKELFDAKLIIAIPLTKEAVKQVEMETELTEREQLVYVTRRTVLRDVQEIKKKVFLMYDKKEGLWKLK